MARVSGYLVVVKVYSKLLPLVVHKHYLRWKFYVSSPCLIEDSASPEKTGETREGQSRWEDHEITEREKSHDLLVVLSIFCC